MFNIPKQNCWVELISDEIIPVLYPGYFNYTTGKEIEVYYLLHMDKKSFLCSSYVLQNGRS